MTPERFKEKWERSTRTEKDAAHEHFLDLCELLDEPKPGDLDPHGEFYTFEKHVSTLAGPGSAGYADVWKKGRFAWEYKKSRRNLVEAYAQLKQYADALGNPPLLIVSDMKEIRVRTNFNNSIAEETVVKLADLNDPKFRRFLKACFDDPDKLRPTITREKVTTKAAAAFAEIARKLRGQGYEPRRVAHFLNKLVFCLFVEDIELLPDRVFAHIVEEGLNRTDDFTPMLTDLFKAMRDREGRFGTARIPWFNGGLFDDDDVLPLGWTEIRILADAARLDWSAIEPSIFGTLFESGLDPDKRKQMATLFDAARKVEDAPSQAGLFDRHGPDRGVGIYYTDRDTIMKIIEPVVMRPLRLEWEAVKAEVARHRKAREKTASPSARTKAENAAREAYLAFRHRLGQFRVLDPACGSGNFLYLALLHLKNFDLAVSREAQGMGLPLDDQRVGPDAVKGIEINPYAAELARVTIWIGELQWQMDNSFGVARRPVLGQLRGIECRDAVLGVDGAEADWPAANVVVGNPPFLGNKRMISGLTEDYVVRLRTAYSGRVSGGADLVCFWFEKARALVEAGSLERAGLVSTNSIRGGPNRKVLERIGGSGTIYDAWRDEPWVTDGAAVRVSLVAFAPENDAVARVCFLDGVLRDEIFADLTSRDAATGVDLTRARRLTENRAKAFMGTTKDGAFDIPGALARSMLMAPVNPNARSNTDVVRPWLNTFDITRKSRDFWIIDFGTEMDIEQAALYEAPFRYIQQEVFPKRQQNRRELYRKFWWRHAEARPGLRNSLRNLNRFIVTTRVSKHRLFIWCSIAVLPDSATIAIARDDETSFGVLHSRAHEIWSLRMGTSLEDRPRYTPTTTFETFPFPAGLTPNIPAADYADNPRARAIAEAARRLNEHREAWLNPPDLVRRVPEVVPGFPDRIVPVSDRAAAELRKRTLTNLYNQWPAWLANDHRELDEAVAAAYGWPADLSDDEILRRLFKLNQERAGRA